MYCSVTLLTQVCFYSSFAFDAKTVFDVQGFTGLGVGKQCGKLKSQNLEGSVIQN